MLKSMGDFTTQVQSAENSDEAIQQLIAADNLFIPQNDNLETLLLLGLLLKNSNPQFSNDLVLNVFSASLLIDMNREHISTMCA